MPNRIKTGSISPLTLNEKKELSEATEKEPDITLRTADLAEKLFFSIKEHSGDKDLNTLTNRTIEKLISDFNKWSPFERVSSAIYDFFRCLKNAFLGRGVMNQTWGVSAPYRILRLLDTEQIKELTTKLEQKRLFEKTLENVDGIDSPVLEKVQKEIAELKSTLKALQADLPYFPKEIGEDPKIKNIIAAALDETQPSQDKHLCFYIRELGNKEMEKYPNYYDAIASLVVDLLKKNNLPSQEVEEAIVSVATKLEDTFFPEDITFYHNNLSKLLTPLPQPIYHGFKKAVDQLVLVRKIAISSVFSVLQNKMRAPAEVVQADSHERQRTEPEIGSSLKEEASALREQGFIIPEFKNNISTFGKTEILTCLGLMQEDEYDEEPFKALLIDILLSLKVENGVVSNDSKEDLTDIPAVLYNTLNTMDLSKSQKENLSTAVNALKIKGIAIS